MLHPLRQAGTTIRVAPVAPLCCCRGVRSGRRQRHRCGTAVVIAPIGRSPLDAGAAAAMRARTPGSAVLSSQAGRLSVEAEAVLRDCRLARAIFVGGHAAISQMAEEQARSVAAGQH